MSEAGEAEMLSRCSQGLGEANRSRAMAGRGGGRGDITLPAVFSWRGADLSSETDSPVGATPAADAGAVTGGRGEVRGTARRGAS